MCRATVVHRVTLFLLALVLCSGQVCNVDGGTNGGDGDGTGGAGATTDGDDGAGTGNGTAPENGTGTGPSSGIVGDHLAAANFNSIPATWIDTAKANYRIFYGHTSHGSQIVTGMNLLYAENSLYAYNAGAGSLSLQEQTGVDLGHEGDTTWADNTRERLDRP